MKPNLKKIRSESLDDRNIEVLAFRLFACQGCQDGHVGDHWNEAERQLSENLFSTESRATLCMAS